MSNLVLGFAMLWGLQGVDLQVHVRELGNDSFDKRETARMAIMTMMDTRGREVYLTLQGQVDQERDLEIKTRISRILTDYRSKNLWIALGDYPLLPWIDMLPHDYREQELCGEGIKELNRQQVIDKYLPLGRAAQGGACSAPDWPDYRLATDFWLSFHIPSWFEYWLINAQTEDQFRKEVSGMIKTVQKTVDAMIIMEDKYHAQRNMINPLRKKE